METKRVAILFVFGMLLLVGFLFYFLVFINEQLTGKLILNETDEHGCLTHQGYTWNATEQACVREWVSRNQSTRYQNFSEALLQNDSNNTEVNWTTNVNITEVSGNSSSVNSTSGNQTVNLSS